MDGMMHVAIYNVKLTLHCTAFHCRPVYYYMYLCVCVCPLGSMYIQRTHWEQKQTNKTSEPKHILKCSAWNTYNFKTCRTSELNETLVKRHTQHTDTHPNAISYHHIRSHFHLACSISCVVCTGYTYLWVLGYNIFVASFLLFSLFSVDKYAARRRYSSLLL